MDGLKNKKLLSISIITNTYNCNIAIFLKNLKSIKSQQYPKQLIEHIIIDAGSTNETLKLARSYGCKILKRPDLLYDSQIRMSIGIKKAKNEIILILESDNILIGTDWLTKMIQPFLEQKNIICTFSMHNGFTKEMPLLTKYLALFGTNDIFLYYLDKTEKMTLDRDDYDKGHVMKKFDNYFVVKFSYVGLPPMGDNGFMVRKNVIDKVNNDSKNFIHVDAFAELVKRGYDTFGVVTNSIIHYSGSSILHQYGNRLLIKNIYYDKLRGKRKYLTFNPNSVHDRIHLFLFIFYSLTFIVPLLRSIKGYLKIQEVAWFLNPIVCFVALVMYAKSEVKFIGRSYFKI